MFFIKDEKSSEALKVAVVDGVTDPQLYLHYIYILIPYTCDLMIERWGDYHGLSGLAQYNDEVPEKRKAGVSRSQKKIQSWRQSTEREGRRCEDAVLLALKMKEGATSQGMPQPLGAEQGKEMDSPLEPPGGMQP